MSAYELNIVYILNTILKQVAVWMVEVNCRKDWVMILRKVKYLCVYSIMFKLFHSTNSLYYLLRFSSNVVTTLYIHINKIRLLFVFQLLFWYQKHDLIGCQQVNTFLVLRNRGSVLTIGTQY